jgi:CMP-N-acetylneuraminic acid synthetase
MKNNNTGVYSCARLSSQRCKNKMMRSFADVTLTDIILRKFSEIGNNTFFSGYESVFKNKCNKYNVKFIQRSEESSLADSPASTIYSFLKDVDYEYLLMINACIPFLKVSTIIEFLNTCNLYKEPTFAVFKKRNYYTDTQGVPYNFNNNISTINTKTVDPVFEFAHVFYFFKREYFIENGWYWDWEKVRYVEIPHGIETFDIDTEEEFLLAETLWKNKELRGGCYG